MFTMMIDVFHS